MAKESLEKILPIMAKDISLMKTNMVKLVRIQGGTPATKASEFFARAAGRENAYEARYDRGRSMRPTIAGAAGGGVASASSGPSSIGDFIKNILGYIVKGGILSGLIMGGAKLLENESVRKGITNFLVSLFESLSSLIRSGLKILGDVFSDPRVWESIVSVFKTLFEQLGRILKTEFKVGDMKLSVGAALAGLVGTMWLLKRAAIAATNALNGVGGRGGVGGVGPRGRRNNRGFSLGKMTLAAAAALGLGWAYDQFVARTGEEPTEEELLREADAGGESGGPRGLTGMDVGKGVAAGIGLYQGARGLNDLTKSRGLRNPYRPKPSTPTTPTPSQGKPLTSFGSVGENREMAKNKTMLEKLKAFFSKLKNNPKKLALFENKLIKRIGAAAAKRLAALGATLAAAPLTGGFSLIVSTVLFLWSVKEIYELYDLVFGEGGLYDEVMNDKDETSPTRAYSEDEISKQQQILHNAEMTYGTLYGNKNASQEEVAKAKRIFESERSKFAKMTGASAGAGTFAGEESDLSRALLDQIAKGESESSGGYNAMNQGGTKDRGIIGSGNSEKIIGKKLTDMTIGEILMRGKKPLGNEDRIFAAGRYQITPNTLQELVASGVAKPEDKFDEKTQDKLGLALLEKRGLSRFQQGNMSAEDFQNSLSKEWGAIANTSGKTSLGGPNKANMSASAAVASLLSGGKIPPSMKPPSETQIASGETPGKAAPSMLETLFASLAEFDKMTGGKLGIDTVALNDALRTIEKEIMSGPSFIDNSTNVNKTGGDVVTAQGSPAVRDENILNKIMAMRVA